MWFRARAVDAGTTKHPTAPFALFQVRIQFMKCLFIRLTKRSKAKLAAIAQEMAESATPNDAIERAIDLASSGGLSMSKCL
jgi:hypothetical protein